LEPYIPHNILVINSNFPFPKTRTYQKKKKTGQEIYNTTILQLLLQLVHN